MNWKVYAHFLKQYTNEFMNHPGVQFRQNLGTTSKYLVLEFHLFSSLWIRIFSQRLSVARFLAKRTQKEWYLAF